MDQMLRVISDALAEKGLSESAASRLAVGHVSFIKNLRNRANGERTHPIEALEKLAGVLDLELVLRPKGERTINRVYGMAEGGGSDRSVDVGFHPEAGKRGRVPGLCLDRDWIKSHGLQVDQVRAVEVPQGGAFGDASDGDVLLLATDPPFNLNGGVFAFFETVASAVKIGRLFQLSTGHIVSVTTADATVNHVPHNTGFRVIGRHLATWRTVLPSI